MCVVAGKDMKMTVLGDRRSWMVLGDRIACGHEELDGTKMAVLGDMIACDHEEFDRLMVITCDTGEVVERIPMPFPVPEAFGLVKLAIGREHLKFTL
jgi:hypothetical protein